MNIGKPVLTKVVMAILAAAIWHGPAEACSWPQGLFSETIRESMRIEGTLKIASIEQEAMTWADDTTVPGSTIFYGAVTDRRGTTTEVEFEISGIAAIRTCTPFALPDADASGTFYLQRLESGRYRLVHWEAAT